MGPMGGYRIWPNRFNGTLLGQINRELGYSPQHANFIQQLFYGTLPIRVKANPRDWLRKTSIPVAIISFQLRFRIKFDRYNGFRYVIIILNILIWSDLGLNSDQFSNTITMTCLSFFYLMLCGAPLILL